MSIWVTPRTLEELNAFEAQTAAGGCGIRFSGIGEDWLEATVPIDRRTAAADGSLHPGALAIVAETVGSIAANLCVDTTTKACLGQALDVNHPEPVTAGPVRARASAVALGEHTHVWNIDMIDSNGARVAVARLTMAIVRARPRVSASPAR